MDDNWSDTQSLTLNRMFDVLRLVPGGGWATDTTGPETYCRTRIRDLAASDRGRRQITRLVDRRTGATIRVRD